MEKVRLQKYLAECGVASRRKSEEYITAGLVKVNGEVITELGVKINPQEDKVEIKSQAGNILQIVKKNEEEDLLKEDEKNSIEKELKPEKKVYILLNKPVGYVTTVNDEKGRSTVM